METPMVVLAKAGVAPAIIKTAAPAANIRFIVVSSLVVPQWKGQLQYWAMTTSPPPDLADATSASGRQLDVPMAEVNKETEPFQERHSAEHARVERHPHSPAFL
jgi:hypothetical protein